MRCNDRAIIVTTTNVNELIALCDLMNLYSIIVLFGSGIYIVCLFVVAFFMEYSSLHANCPIVHQNKNNEFWI